MIDYKLPIVDGQGVIDMHIHVGPEFMIGATRQCHLPKRRGGLALGW